jgi:hypothetical protein
MRIYTEAEHTRTVGPLWRTICGWICLVLGLAGLLLPLLPGVPLLFAGLFMLSNNYQWARKCLLWLKTRLRKIADRKRSSPNTISYPRRVQR